ncbi:GNAT family N-acetyltransferase [Flaviaesturariibacter flavus]|uniref:GNAT family N-acetyltransferase n=1 Tax=Flaviaesturariibacter flavus TaxID=2502780 RepID=A0A4R1BA40_9BACT|nr:GNAT family N-acetyltransferase [Flaviaesturariibacter flavus]TCJ13768.1 GNAT family N-acetyltransferase [Flaviaesturariibacter flavus]
MPFIKPATAQDIPDLIQLLNRAYRGNAARAGWTHEADLIEGEQRTDESELTEKLQHPDATLLKWLDDSSALRGCVYLEKKGSDLYLGMLSVDPEAQGGGVGKKLLQAAEGHALQSGCTGIVMTVISVRTELLEWYQRHGYAVTGKEEPFPDDPRFGKPKQPLFFKWLRKQL